MAFKIPQYIIPPTSKEDDAEKIMHVMFASFETFIVENMTRCSFIYFFNIFLKFIYFETEHRQRKSTERETESERDRERISSRLCG